MAKKKKVGKNGLMLLTAITVCFGFVACIMMFLPALKLSYTIPLVNKEISTTIAGMEAVFGGKFESNGISVETLKFSVGSLIGYLLPLLGVIVSLLAYKFRNTILYVVAAVLCLAGAVMIFLEPTFFASVNGLTEILESLKNSSLTLQAGPIIGGICAIIATLGSAAGAVVKK